MFVEVLSKRLSSRVSDPLNHEIQSLRSGADGSHTMMDTTGSVCARNK